MTSENQKIPVPKHLVRSPEDVKRDNGLMEKFVNLVSPDAYKTFVIDYFAQFSSKEGQKEMQETKDWILALSKERLTKNEFKKVKKALDSTPLPPVNKKIISEETKIIAWQIVCYWVNTVDETLRLKKDQSNTVLRLNENLMPPDNMLDTAFMEEVVNSICSNTALKKEQFSSALRLFTQKLAEETEKSLNGFQLPLGHMLKKDSDGFFIE